MKNKPPVNDNLTTKIIPGLLNDYRIVSLPYWAWYWLEDFMIKNRISYQGIYETFGNGQDLNQTLHNIAELHHEHAMREVYNLSNDNEPDEDVCITHIYRQKSEPQLNLPKIYKLFGFMPCATTLEAVWERRHYEESNKV
ncbi:MAG: hypothetical protein AAGB32_01745 [Pseudomonadota bacterium]